MCVRLAKIIDHKSQINLKSQNLTKINLFKIKNMFNNKNVYQKRIKNQKHVRILYLDRLQVLDCKPLSHLQVLAWRSHCDHEKL